MGVVTEAAWTGTGDGVGSVVVVVAVDVSVKAEVAASPMGDMARGGGRGLGDQPRVMKDCYTSNPLA